MRKIIVLDRKGLPGTRVRLFILDPHAIYRRGLVACLAGAEGIDEVMEAETIENARENPRLADCDVLLIDHDLPGSAQLMRTLAEADRPRVIVCSSRNDEHDALAAVQAGAVGYLPKETLTPEKLEAGIRAAANGAGVMAPELLGKVLHSIGRVSREVLEPRGLSISRLSAREKEVLRLVAEGLPTREVADRLCYSERTIKNVIHDAVVKLNARTRSQAVAAAVREGLI